MNELGTSAHLHGRIPKAEMASRAIAAIFPAVDKVRKDSGIFTPEAEVVKKTLAALNDEVTRDLLGESWRRQGKNANPKTIAHGPSR